MKLLLLLIITPFIVFCQNDSITSSNYYERLNSNHENLYFNIDDNVFYVKILKEYIVLEKFSLSENKLINTKKVPALNKNEQLEKVLKVDDEFYLFYSYWDKKNKLEQLFSMKIDFDNLTLESGIKILENDTKLSGDLVYKGYYKYETLNKYRFSLSKNQKNLLISFQLKPTGNEKYNRDYMARFGIYKFDKNLSKNGTIYTMLSPFVLSSYFDFLISNTNEVYILSEVYENEERYNYTGEDKNYHLELLKLKEGNIDITKLSEKDYYIKDLKLAEGINNDIIIAGYYLEAGFLTDVEGLFYCSVNNKKVNTSYLKIPVGIINAYETEFKQKKNFRLLKKGKLGFEYLVLNNIEIDNNGNVIVIGEQFQEKENVIGGSEPIGKIFKFFYDDILVTKLSRNGELQWMKKLPKKQYGDLFQTFIYYRKKNTVRNLSFSYMKKEDKLVFLHWAKSNNVNLSINEAPREYTDEEWGKLVYSEFDYSTGEIKQKIIINPKKYMSDISIARFNYFRMPIKDLVFTKEGVFFEIRDFGNNASKRNIGIHIEF